MNILNAQRHLVIAIEVYRKCLAVVYGKHHTHVTGIGTGAIAQEVPDLLTRYIKCGSRRIPIDARGDKRKSNARDPQSSRLVKCRAIGAAQKPLFAMAAIYPTRPHRVNDPTRRQVKAPCHHGAARGTRSDSAACRLQLLMTRSGEDGAAHAAAREQALVRSVDDSVDVQPGDIGPHDRKRHVHSPLPGSTTNS